MKVFALVILVVAAASGKGSGPYLPSGWRPQGPAFFLPSEVKPSENPLQDVILAGSEASGSDFLREYGPPKVQEISQNLINQGLPDVATEQTFDFVPIVVEEIKEIIVETAAENAEAKTEETATEQSEATTEAALEENAVSVDLPIVEVESIVETSTLADSVETTSTNVEYAQFQNVESSESSQSSEESESIQQSSQESSSNVEVSNEENIASEQVSQESVNQQESVLSQQESAASDAESAAPAAEVTLQQAQNIPDIIASLEEEIKAQQAEVSEAVSDVTAAQAAGAVEQAPEGFLEYGPPGFAEYGPPKGELTQEANEDNTASFENNNETRRRRFSPKFKSSKKH